jgi:ATP-dependent exoDNAse (exonuclease V) alpha subunit
MVRQLVLSGNGVDVVVAPAGTGKTYAIGVARDVWTLGGYQVRGVALSGRAATELQASARVPSSTIASFLGRFPYEPLSGRDVLVIDEAGMVGTRTLAQLLEHAARARAKVVLVGDHRQLPAIEAGGLLRGLTERLPTIELAENRRQREPWERAALIELRHGDLTQALHGYLEHDRVHIAPDADTARRRTIDAWAPQHLAGDNAVILAARHTDVAELNRLARERLVYDGVVHGPAVEAGERRFQIGDRVVALRNDYTLDLRNGHTGTVIHTDPERRSALVKLDIGGLREIPAGYLDAGLLGHGYAVTIHKAQGLTVDHAHLYAAGPLDRELTYVALSRGRATNHIHLADPERRVDAHALEVAPPAAMDRLARRLEAEHARRLAIDDE